MKLTQAQRNELRYALEDSGMPEVLAYMAAQRATSQFNKYCKINIDHYFLWKQTPEGWPFWRGVFECQLGNTK